MPANANIDLLNRLLQIHFRSLPMYLREVRPWEISTGDERVAVLQDIMADHKRIACAAADWVMRRGGVIRAGEFPMEFTDLHDLSLDFLIHEVILYQRRQVEEIRRCLETPGIDPPVRSLVEEALGAAQGHLQSLQELAGQAGAPA